MRPLGWTLLAVWIAVLAGATIAIRQQHIPLSLAFAAALIAAALEASCYVAAGFRPAREWVGASQRRSLWIALSALPAYVIYAVGSGTFNWRSLLALCALSVLMAYWFELLPAHTLTDCAFLAVVALGLLTELAAFLYPPLSPKLKTDYIGRILWLRLAYWAILVVRGRGDMGFGFIPDRKDWIIGARFAAYCSAVAAIVLWLVQPMRLKDHLTWGLTPLVVLGTFFGFLWVVAMSEELLARGVLQGDLTRAFHNEWSSVVVTSLLFGLVHLSYGHRFPNWRMVLLAGVLGLFCGRAAQLAGSIRASMVTHALVVTIFRVFLTER